MDRRRERETEGQNNRTIHRYAWSQLKLSADGIKYHTLRCYSGFINIFHYNANQYFINHVLKWMWKRNAEQLTAKNCQIYRPNLYHAYLAKCYPPWGYNLIRKNFWYRSAFYHTHIRSCLFASLMSCQRMTYNYGHKSNYSEYTTFIGTQDSKAHGSNMGPTWGWQFPGGPHVGLINIAIWDYFNNVTDGDV